MSTPTQKPLRQMVPEIMTYINDRFESNIIYAREQLDILNGGVKKYIEESIRKEILSPKSLNVMLERIIPINILKQEVSKLSKAYADGTSRETEKSDQDLVDYYQTAMAMDSVMGQSNKIFNLHKYVGLEPFLDHDGKPKLRVLDASHFIPYSDDPLDPTRMTVAVKWFTTIDKTTQVIDPLGNKLDSPQDVIRKVKVYYLYSSTEFLILDSDGDVRQDLMNEMGNSQGSHNIGQIPIILVKEISSDLVPMQDTSMRDISVSISKKLTDLSFATLYQSHSMFYGIDVDVSNLDSNPDAFLDIKSDSGDPANPKSPQIGILQPKVNIPETLELIETELALHLQSMGLTVGEGKGGNSVKSAASGVAKLIDEAGAEQSLKEQRQMYKAAEENGLWRLIGALHNMWMDEGAVDFDQRAPKDLEVSVTFTDKKPSESESVLVERVIKQMEAGLMSKRRAVMAVNPAIAQNTDRIDEIMAELEDEKETLVFAEPAPEEEE